VQTYQRLTTEFPTSGYAGDAKKALESLKAGA
jgi:outer membrane protein assembly factor BamD (BamD/ComL family)